jgi:hypothetical protein
VSPGRSASNVSPVQSKRCRRLTGRYLLFLEILRQDPFVKHFAHPDPRLLLPMLLVAIAAPAVLPEASGAVVALVAFSVVLLAFVRARVLRGWLVAALVVAAVTAAAVG